MEGLEGQGQTECEALWKPRAWQHGQDHPMSKHGPLGCNKPKGSGR